MANWFRALEVSGSNPAPYRYLDLFSVVPSLSSLVQILYPTAIWICPRQSRVQLLDRVANWSASHQLGFLKAIFGYLFTMSPISTIVLNTFDT